MNKEGSSSYNNWLDSCYQETLLPNSPWHKIMKSVNTALAQEVKQLSNDSEVTLCIIKHLGPRFVDEFLINQEAFKCQSLNENPKTNEQAVAWLKNKMDQILSELKLKNIDNINEEISSDMLEYQGFVHQVVYKGIDRKLSIEEKKEKNLHFQSFANGSLISGIQSETLGQAVSCLLHKHPSQLQRVTKHLQGRQLPNSLRQLIWKLKIFKAEILLPEDIEPYIESLKTEFLSVVESGQKELGISMPVCSTVDGIICHAVHQIYDEVPCFDNNNIRRFCVSMAIRALNILYVQSRMYEPHYALLLLPLVWTYSGYAAVNEFSSLSLSIKFYYFLQNCFPTRLQVFTSADHVVTRLQKDDPVLFKHMIEVIQKNVTFDPREFLVNFMHQEKEKAMPRTCQQSQANDEDYMLQTDARALLSHPIIFMRKWIGDGFVGILDFPAILFVWDQCFLTNWNPSTLENVCLVLLELLRSRLFQAADFHGIKNVLLNHAYSLYTHDIQQGLRYLSNGCSLIDVSSLRQPSHISNTPSPEEDQCEEDKLSTRQNDSSMDDYVELGELWVEKKSPDSPPKKLRNTESFHVYIDEVRFIPDNATVVKVTGRILNPLWKKPTSLDISDVEGFALLDSPARCPQFQYRYAVRQPQSVLSHDCVLLLRVYTLDVDTGELVVIGNCALDLYKQEEDEYFLNVGGHQMRLKHELPSTVSKLSEELFTQLTSVPVASLLVRILPNSEEFVESPGYSSGYYNSSACKPNESETKLYHHYKQLQPYPPTVSEAIRDIREEELDNDEEITSQKLEQWYRQRLSKQQLDRKPARSLELTHVVQYDQHQGLFFSVNQAFGLPNPTFVNVLTFVSLGPDAKSKRNTEESHSGEEIHLFDKRDFSSLQKSPKWINEPKVLHPHLDQKSSLVVQLYSLDGIYEPNSNRQEPGTVKERKGKTLTLLPQGWTVVQPFNGKYVNAGVHHVPLFSGRPSSSFMEFLSANPGDVSLHEAVRQDIHQLQGTSSIQVTIWDGHYSREDCIPLPRRENMLSLGNETKIKKTMQALSGKRLSEVVMQYLTKQERKIGVDGQQYQQEQHFYEEAMNREFYGLIDSVLLQLGLSPLS